jgi:serine protease Do
MKGPTMVNSIADLDHELAELIAEARRSLVRVANRRRGAGAGTIWHAAGMILTNAHVAGDGPVDITLADGRTYPGRLQAIDRRLDLAVLTIEADGLPEIALGSSKSLRAGELVVALGHPWGVEGAATAGVVIGVGSSLGEAPIDGRELLAVSLHLRPGHSGGALIDASGRLVGLNTMMAGPDVGLAIPVDVVKRFVGQALSNPQARAA